MFKKNEKKLKHKKTCFFLKKGGPADFFWRVPLSILTDVMNGLTYRTSKVS